MQALKKRIRITSFLTGGIPAALSTVYAVVLGCVACGSDGNETGNSSSLDPGRTSLGGGTSTGGTSTGRTSAGGTSAGGTSTGYTGGSSHRGTAGTAGSGTLTSCEPLDLSAWTPPVYVPPRHADVCTAAEVADYYDECLAGTDCTAFTTSGSSAACGSCLTPSGYSESTYGPVLLAQSAPSHIYLSNTSGCIDLMGEPECAAKIQAADSCARAACTEPCTANGLLSYSAYQNCEETARATVCAGYVAAAVCIVDAGHAAACRGSDGSFKSLYAALANVFCG